MCVSFESVLCRQAASIHYYTLSRYLRQITHYFWLLIIRLQRLEYGQVCWAYILLVKRKPY